MFSHRVFWRVSVVLAIPHCADSVETNYPCIGVPTESKDFIHLILGINLCVARPMWDCLYALRGQSPLKTGDRLIYVDANHEYRTEEQQHLEKAIRKVRRVLYENGFVKEDLYSNWQTGLTTAKDARVARWKRAAKIMEFTEQGKTYEARCKELMGF